jgi:hypothetical protein
MIVASLEATLISALFGRKVGNYFSDRRIRKDHLKEFMLYEKLPYALGKYFDIDCIVCFVTLLF